MIERIIKNEDRLDNACICIQKMQEAINEFKKNKKDINLLKKYYGSKKWFSDKEAYENSKIPKIKAGVLSEDGVWDMLSNLDEIVLEMKKIFSDYIRR